MEEECRLGIFEGRILRRIFGPKKDGVTESGEECLTRSSVICESKVIPLQARCGPEGG